MGKIFVFGDSIVYGKWDEVGGWVIRLRKYIDKKYNFGKNVNLQVYSLGIPSETASHLVERFEKELRHRTDIKNRNLLLIAIGINDSCPNNRISGKQTPEQIFKQYFRIMVNIGLKYNSKVVCIGLTPVNPQKIRELLFSNENVIKYDTYISDVCKELKVEKLDLFDELNKLNFSDLLVDSVHPNSQGHQLLFEKIKVFLEKRKLFDWVSSIN